ncbi:hypothetical protein ACFC60_28165 [Kitasatospora purpeofusca]|uniref:WXG100-like domain-containing protein n=1 Tax=Kitasatospora purpeofusca TaxID=67352 RepID=UPI0035D9F17B
MKYTDFRQFSHAELRAMVQALNPGEVMAAADPWRRAADTLKAIRTTLTRASTEAATTWEGSTSDAFHTRMLHLATTINTAASYANDAAITLKAVSEAIAEAKRNMPEEPSGWAQFKDGVGDTFSSLFGADDEDSRTDLANQKKAEAATVLQTLAMHYRTAAPMLKPPPPPGQPPKPGAGGRNDGEEETGGDAGGFAALGGVFSSSGFGASGGVGTSGGVRSSASGSAADRSPYTGDRTESGTAETGRPGSGNVATRPAVSQTPVPADTGVKGGVPLPAPARVAAPSFGAGTTIDGISGSSTAPSTSPGGPFAPAAPSATPGLSPSGQGTSSAGGPVVPPARAKQLAAPAKAMDRGLVAEREPVVGQVAERAGVGRSGRTNGEAGSRGSAAFGPEGIPGVSSGTGSGRRGATNGAAPVGGGVVGGNERPGSGASGKRVFTEGGSGIGARSRGRVEPASGSPMTQAPLFPPADSRRKRDEEKRRRRPDYLVEDEGTWESGGDVNPGVVK